MKTLETLRVNGSTTIEIGDKMQKEKKIEVPNGTVVTPAPNALVPQRRRVQLHTGTECLVEQAHKADCDINNIIARFSGDELRAFIQQDPGAYQDLSNAVDLKTAMDTVIESERLFDALPSAVRKKFNNNPIEFLEFAQDKKNGKAMVDMGLAIERPKIDPPASRSDIEKLGKALSPNKAGEKTEG